MKKLYFFLIAFCTLNIGNAQWIQQTSGVTDFLGGVYFNDENIKYYWDFDAQKQYMLVHHFFMKNTRSIVVLTYDRERYDLDNAIKTLLYWPGSDRYGYWWNWCHA